MPLEPDCEWVTTMAPPSLSTRDATSRGDHVLAAALRRRRTSRAGAAGQRGLIIREQLAVIVQLEGISGTCPQGRRSPGPGACFIQVCGFDEVRHAIGGAHKLGHTRRGWDVRWYSRGRRPSTHAAGVRMCDVRAGRGRAGLDEVAEPSRIGAVIGDPADIRALSSFGSAVAPVSLQQRPRPRGAGTYRFPSVRVPADRPHRSRDCCAPNRVPNLPFLVAST